MVSGNSISPYLGAFKTDLFLNTNESDVREAINSNVVADMFCEHSKNKIKSDKQIEQIRIAFDGDAVIFSDELKRIFKNEGLDPFTKHEEANLKIPCLKGHLPKYLKPFLLFKNNLIVAKLNLCVLL